MTTRAFLASLTLLGIAAALAWAFPQVAGGPPAPTSSELYAQSAVAGDAAYKLGPVLIDPPLLLSRDAASAVHLSLGPQSVQIVTVHPVRNEVPVLSSAGPATGWQLAHVPADGATCFRNGARQMPGVDYKLSVLLLSSASWQLGDALVCDYEW